MVSKKDNYSKVLSEEEKLSLKSYESRLLMRKSDSNYESFAVHLIMHIYSDKLYRDKYKTLNEYCLKRLGYNKKLSLKYVNAAKILLKIFNSPVYSYYVFGKNTAPLVLYSRFFPETLSQFIALGKEKDNDTRANILFEIFQSKETLTESLIEKKIKEKKYLKSRNLKLYYRLQSILKNIKANIEVREIEDILFSKLKYSFAEWKYGLDKNNL